MVKIYSLFHTLKYKIHRVIDIIHTKCRLCGNDVKYQHYRIIGVPIIEKNKNSKIVFGENLQMNNGLKANHIGYSTPCILKAFNAQIIIGDNVGMSQTVLLASGADIKVGNNVKFGGGVKLYTTDFHSIDYKYRRTPKTDYQYTKHLPITIGDDCFIGAGSIILKGVTIGARSIIGAGSVVTKSIPSDEIWAGNPAKFIRKI